MSQGAASQQIAKSIDSRNISMEGVKNALGKVKAALDWKTVTLLAAGAALTALGVEVFVA